MIFGSTGSAVPSTDQEERISDDKEGGALDWNMTRSKEIGKDENIPILRLLKAVSKAKDSRSKDRGDRLIRQRIMIL